MPSFNIFTLSKNLDHVHRQRNCKAKVNIAFGLVSKNIEDGTCKYKHKTVMESSKLLCKQDDMANLKDKLPKVHFVVHCTRERAKTNWKFYKFINTVFASFLKDTRMSCKNTA